jgi:PAS domain S-box-containing protein
VKSPALRRPIFWFAPAAVLFAAVALISMSSTRALIETDDRVSHTYEVIGRIESLRAGLANTESSRQAYLLTGDPAHLKPYLASSGHLDEDFAQLRRLTSDNVEQQRRLDQLGPLLSGERRALKESIDAGPSTDLAVRVSATAQSARTREQVDALLTEMHVEENRLLQVRTEEARESAQNTVVVVAGAIILTMVLVCIAALIARRDSLERKRSEEALHESQARLAGIIDSAMDAIITLDADQRVILFNAAAERIFGYSAAQVIGQSISILLPERFRASLQGLLSAFGEPGSAGGSAGAAGARLALRSDGSEFPIEASVSTVQVAGTKLFTVILRDATERERADAERRRLTRAVEQSPASIVITDPKGVIEYVNPKFCQITGYSSEEVIGQNPRVLKSGEISPEGYRRLWETISSGGEWRGEFHNRKKNGELYWELASISPVLNSAGTIKHYVAVKEDITERKRAEVELAEQYEAADHARSETRAVLDSAGEAIILIGPDRRFRMVNRRFGEVFGIPAEDIVGHYFDEFEEYARRVFADLEEVRAYIVRAAYDTWEPFTETVAQSWPVAREHELYSTAVRGTDGDYLGRLYVFRDVTHEREVDRMKTEFVSLVSHELRTPLTSIKGFTDLILDGVAGPVTDQQGEYLGIVKQNSDRLVALVNDILDISRIESGRMQ